MPFQQTDKFFLADKKTIPQKQNINDYFKELSDIIFKDSKKDAGFFSKQLQEGNIALSSNILKNIFNPSSAAAKRITPNLQDGKLLTSLTPYLAQGKGIGINLNNEENPIDKIKKINSYFKYYENSFYRKPAGMIALNYNHPKIIDFITLKDNEEYKNWCLDLSIILPKNFINKLDNNENIILTNGEIIPSQKLYGILLNSIIKKGEPGIIFSDNKDIIFDPCGTKEIKEGDNLTISHINLSKFYDKSKNKIDENKLKENTAILAKAVKKLDKNSCIGVVGYQELLDNANLKYASKNALGMLERCLKIIQNEAHKYNVKTAISPTSTVSKYLNVTAGIQPKNYENISYSNQLETLSSAIKYIDYNISNTIILNKNDDTTDADKIIRYAVKHNLKGITMFKKS